MKNFVNTTKYIIIVTTIVFGFSVSSAYAIDCTTNQLHLECYGNGNYNYGNNNNDSDILNVSTLSATNIDNDSATLRGDIVDLDESEDYIRFFKWGTSSGNLNHTSTLSGTTDNEGTFSKTISGLEEDEEYFYRACAREDDGGDEDCGSVRSFTTDDNNGNNSGNDDDDNDNYSNNGENAVITTDASNVAKTTAILNGVVTNYSGNQTVWFEWGPTTTLGYTTPTKIVSSHQSLVSSQISGLTPGKAYFYRIKSNSGEMGDIRAFITLASTSLTTSGGTTTTTGNGNVSGSNSNQTNGSNLLETVQYLNLDIISSANEAKPGDTVTFAVVYENLNRESLKNVRLVIDFPQGIVPTKIDAGQFISKQTIELVRPSISALTRERFVIEAQINSNLAGENFLVTVAEATYDHPTQGGVRVTTTNSSIVKVVSVGGQGAGVSGIKFFPLVFLGWLLIIIAIIVIFLLVRKMLKDKEEEKNKKEIEKHVEVSGINTEMELKIAK